MENKTDSKVEKRKLKGLHIKKKFFKSVSIEDALLLVKSVIGSGRISEAAGIKHYCWVSTWK